MLFSRGSRLLCSLAIMMLFATSCGAEAAVDLGSPTDEAAVADTSTEDNSSEPEPTAAPEPTAEPEPTAAAEPTAVPEPAASQDTATEDQDASAAAGDDGARLGNRDEAVAFLIGEGFIAPDAGCLADGAYEVFGTWDFATLDPDPDQSADLDELLEICVTVAPGPAAGSPPPGTDAELDALWIACDGGSARACDDLYFESPSDSDYEAFGLSCGGRAIDDCSDVLGTDSDEPVDGPAPGSPPPGTDAALDALWIACDGGSANACDELFWTSPGDSEYEDFGLSCGGRSLSELCSAILDD